MSKEGLGGKLLKGSFWMLAMRWSMRFIGLISMSIVARLLTPDDFGVFAVASSLIGLLDATSDTGTDIAIIRHKNPQRQHYDTAWTIKIIVSSVIALLIAAMAPLSNALYPTADDRYEKILEVMALSMFIGGFANIGIADFRRNLEFHKDFKYTLYVQVIGFATTILTAFLLRSYWALVLGGFSRSVFGVLLSFLMHSYRPRLSLEARRELFGFSFWIMVRSLAMFLTGRGDRLVLGAYYSTSLIGWYAIAGELAQLAVFELLLPIGRALLPGLAAKHEDQEWERRNLRKIFNGVASIATGMGLGLAALAEPTITLIYGENFSGAAPLLQIMALAFCIDGFSQPVGQYLIVHGRTRELAMLYIISGVFSVGAAYWLSIRGADILVICYARVGISLFSLLRVFYLLRSLRSMGWRDMLVAWFRPVAAGAAMFYALWGLHQLLNHYSIADLLMALQIPWKTGWGERNMQRIALLAVGVPLGAAVYSGALLASWYLLRRPPGIEEEIMQRIFKRR